MSDINAARDGRRMSLSNWVWRAWWRAAVVPLLLVEAVIIVVYLLATTHATEENLATTRALAREELARIAQREAVIIDRELASISSATRLYARQVRHALTHPKAADLSEMGRYASSPDGTWHTRFDPNDNERCAVYFSSLSPINDERRARTWALAALDPLMNDILRTSGLVSQIYFNSHDSLNRICPPFDVLKQYPPGMDIPTFNFYYLADAKHNPPRDAVWTDAYVDPAGQGWMASSIAPVYRGDFLEGVVGLDVTLDSFARRVLNLGIPWSGYGVLIGRDGTILAMPAAAEVDFGMAELKEYHYAEAVRRDTFKPDSYNVFKRADLAPLAQAFSTDTRVSTMTLKQPLLVSWESIPTTGWRLAVLVPEEGIFAAVNDLDERLRGVGYWMIAGVVVFYVLFMVTLLWRARALATTVAGPLARMDAMAADIARGHYHQEPIDHPVVEIQRTSNGLVIMGRELEVAAERVSAARRNVERQAAFLQVIIDTVPVPVFFTDPSGALAGANQAFNAIADRLADNTRTALVDGLRGEKADSFLWSAQGEVRGEFVCRRCQLPGTAEDPERSSGVVGVLVDITAQRQAQVLAEKARDEALEASRLKSEFLASVSHEIRTPMNGVIGVAELLAGTQLDDEQREYLRAIQDSAQALLVVINDILDFARIEAGRVATISEPFDICAVVDGVVDILTPRARQKGLELLVFVDPQLPRTLVGDGGRIRQVLLNLVGNAVKFTEQGHVAIDVVPVGAIANRYGVRFTVADTGPGIEQGARHRLFQPFSQVDASNGRRHGGTGLGLSISKHLVEAMGGDIGFAPRDGGGAVFAFEVPLEPGSEAASSEATLHVRTGTIIGIHTDSALRFEHLARWVQSLGAVPMRLGDPGIQPPNTLEPRVMLVVDAAPTTLSALIERWPRALQVVVSTTRNDSIPSDIMRIPWPLRGRSLATVLERMA